MEVVVRAAVEADLPSWLELVREVEPLFGPMPDFATHARRAIDRGTALVVAEHRHVLGAALLSRNDQPHHIHWLAVRAAARRRGIGTRLMATILSRWPRGDISVVTFGPDRVDGRPARHYYYTRYGFTNAGVTEPGPDGTSRDRYVRVGPA